MKNQIKTRKGGCIGSLIKWFLIFLVIILAFAYFFSGFVVDKVISTVGKTAGIEMNSNTKISFFPLEFEMRDFYIANPDGFSKNKAISLKEVRLEMPINPAALMGSEPLEIDEIRIIAPYLSFEKQGLLSETNLSAIQKKLMALVPASKGGSPEPKEVKKESGEPRKFIIKKIVFEDGKVNTVLGGKSVEVPLPSFTLTDLGVKENGLTGSEIASTAFVSLTVQAVEAVTKNAADAGVDILKEGTKEGSGALQNALKGILGN